MPKLIVTLKDECCRCTTKIQNVLTCDADEFCIEKIEFEKCKVTITGKFDADKLNCRLWSTAGKFIKSIEKVEDKKEEKKKEEKKEPPCKLVNVYPWPYQSSCPYPYQAPYGAYPWWQGSCGSCYPQQCQCYSYCKPPSPSPSPCACAKCRPSCSSSCDHHGGHGYCSGSSCSPQPVIPSNPAPVPFTLPTPLIVCDDNPSYACSVM